MFKKLYGETEVMQFKYLRLRVILCAIDIALVLLGLLFHVFGADRIAAGVIELASGAFVILVLMWAWGFLRAWFGWTSFFAIFTGNIVFGVVIFVLYITLGCLLGLFGFLLGTGRFIYLTVKHFTKGLEG